MNWLRKSVRNKLLLLLLVVTIIPITIGLFIAYSQSAELVKETAIEDNKRLLSKGSKSIEFYFDLVNKGTISIYEIGDSNENLLEQFIRDVDDYKKIHLALLYIYNALDYFEQINLYKLSTGQSYLMRKYLTSNDVMTDTSYRTKDDRSTFVEPPHTMTNYSTPHLLANSQKKVLSFHRKIYDIPSDDLVGYISIDISLEAITAFTEDLYNPNDELITIIDRFSKKVIYSSDEKRIGKTIPYSWYKSANDYRDLHYIEDDLSQLIYLLHPIKTKAMDWIIVKEITYDSLYKPTKPIARINILLAITLVALMTIVATYVSFHFTSPLKALIKDMDRIKGGELEGTISITRQDELGILEKNYMEMTESLRDMIRYKYTLELANKENQIRVLQAQINPHFIGNILQAIATESLEQGSMKVYQLILKLSKMMNYSMETENTLIPLVKELDYTINYMDLQKQRYNGQFHYTTTLDPALENFHVPKMLLQPIVENYFIHGFDQSSKIGKISIDCSLKENVISLVIKNNGRSIPPSKLEEIRHSIAMLDVHDKQIGLANVSKRLALYYQNQGSLTIENTHCGVAIRIFIYWEDMHEDTHS